MSRETAVAMCLLFGSSACSPMGGEAQLFFGQNPVDGWYNPALAGCSRHGVRAESTPGAGDGLERTTSWDELGRSDRAEWEGGCRTSYRLDDVQVTATCDLAGLPTQESLDGKATIEWTNTTEWGRVVHREGTGAFGVATSEDFVWADDRVVSWSWVENGQVLEADWTRTSAGWTDTVLGDAGDLGRLPDLSWVGQVFTFDAADRLTHMATSSQMEWADYTYAGDARLPEAESVVWVGGEGEGAEESWTFTWDCPSGA